ncbi:hypothetical protein FGG08_001569 [Glutinoglossum americanum]|uniref:RNA polymerase II subunit B1 CTD phosphatase RPAP2 homolog n=1 Tax=Glutinoglossum americanum TaxID=1670608 RepID=A0A9P8I1W5_9PEZI|nr:hypothetical protein FGG08_001569 [Glutinoglossum americanum]
MASKSIPKSILKKPPMPHTSKEEQDRRTAIYHAEIIQHRKDLELTIINATETLIDFPSAATADPAAPSHEDASAVRSLLVPFQPSDYDGLIQERNIDGKCGYVLCPRPRLLQDTKALFRLLRVGRQEGGLRVVPRESLEKWCSEACQRKAMYVRVQLSEEPAWMREAMEAEIVFLDEVERKRNAEASDHQINKLAEGIGRAQIGNEEWHQRGDELRELARERGETGVDGKVIVTIKENFGPPKEYAPEPPSLKGGERLETKHLLVEGYLPKEQKSARPPGNLGNQCKYDRDDHPEWISGVVGDRFSLQQHSTVNNTVDDKT